MLTREDVVSRSNDLLRELAGPTAVLREDQIEAVVALVVDRRRVLVVQRTGWGKSAVYFLAAKLLRESGAGPTILVSPLLALMRDQIRAAAQMGLVATTINSANVDEWREIEKRLAADEVDLIAISPERLNNPAFVDEVLPDLADRVGLVVVDEAHCISQWGHDFRPDYLRIRDALARIDPATPVLATTATATNWVVDDVAHQLGAEPLTLRGTLDRASLALSVVALGSPAERLAWLAHHLPSMPGSGIVYCLTQGTAEEVADWLSGQGMAAAAYTGATDPTERERLEHALRNNELKVLAATSALGMGFDKPDLAFAISLGSPASITAYYQMVGRAGRALDHAEGVLLPGREDQRIWDWFDQVSFPPRPIAESVVRTLDRADRPLSEARIEAAVDIKRTRLMSLLKVLDVEGAVKRGKGGWSRTAQPWEYNEQRYERVRAARRVDQQQMLGYQSATTCRMAFLRAALDDPELSDGWVCRRCDICCDRSVEPPPPTLVATAALQARQVEVVLPARKMWPSGLDDRKGKIDIRRQALDGRALTTAGAPGWANEVNALLDDPDALATTDLVDACGALLKTWGWPDGRATWITWVPSTRRPTLGRSLAEQLGHLGRLPVRESLRRVIPARPQAEMSNSAHGCANVIDVFEPVMSEAEVPRGPALIVDDTWVSGWTITVVADLLQLNGVDAIYPLVLQKG